jgi:hypothetical protein
VTGNAITHLDAKPAPGFFGLYTVTRDANGAMKIKSWKIAAGLNAISMVGEFKSDDSAVEAVAIGTTITATSLTPITPLTPLAQIAPLAGPVAIAASKTAIAAAVKLATGQMAIYTFATTPHGNIGHWTGERFIGPVNLIEIFASPVDDASFVTLTSGDDLNQTLIGWTADPYGANLRRVGTSRTGTNAGIAGSMIQRSYPNTRDRGLLANAVIQPNSKMELIIWDTNLARGDDQGLGFEPGYSPPGTATPLYLCNATSDCPGTLICDKSQGVLPGAVPPPGAQTRAATTSTPAAGLSKMGQPAAGKATTASANQPRKLWSGVCRIAPP